MATKIPWADESWNPISGCTPCSEGCENCYAKRMAPRLAGRFGYPADEPFRVTLHSDKLSQPYHWRKPRRIFVCSMGDFFHEDVPFSWQQNILNIINWGSGGLHTFMLLTKRPGRMRDVLRKWYELRPGLTGKTNRDFFGGPSSSMWLGVTVENQRRADERIPRLWDIASAVRFVSFEPLLTGISCGNLNLVQRVTPGLDWIIIGCESGPRPRPCKLDWVRSLVDQADAAWVPVFVKQLEINGKVTSDPADWPEWARRQEFPKQES